MTDIETRLDHLQRQFESGDGHALLNAVGICLNTGTKAPNWVQTGFNAAWTVRWESGQARTLDDAFDIQRPKGWSQKRSQKDAITTLIWQSVVQYRQKHKVAIDRDLFEAVAEEWNQQRELEPEDSMLHGLKINGTDVQEAYYAVTNLSKKPVI